MDTDAELDAPVRRDYCISLGHCALYRERAAHRVDDARKFDKQSIAGGLDDAAAMLGDLRITQFAPDCPQGGERALFVSPHEPRVAGDICRQDRSQSALDPLS